MSNVKTYYEIWNKTEDEPLVDGLTFEDAAEMSKVYMDFYGEDVIVVCARDVRTKKIISSVQAYKNAWINYFEELLQMGNLEYS